MNLILSAWATTDGGDPSLELSTACQEQPAEEDGSDQESCLNFSVHV